jgi:hypothetical protein
MVMQSCDSYCTIERDPGLGSSMSLKRDNGPNVRLFCTAPFGAMRASKMDGSSLTCSLLIRDLEHSVGKLFAAGLTDNAVKYIQE